MTVDHEKNLFSTVYWCPEHETDHLCGYARHTIMGSDLLGPLVIQPSTKSHRCRLWHRWGTWSDTQNKAITDIDGNITKSTHDFISKVCARCNYQKRRYF